MKYTIENIKVTNGFIFFWGHQPSKDGSITKTCLSQWWKSSFTVEGIEYKTAEHWMMAKKAELFEDKEIFEKIIRTENPSDVKNLGRKVADFDVKKWEENCYEIVKKGNYYKFYQNEILKDFLLKTEEKIIVEASPVDFIWGIGLDENNKDAMLPKNWKGLNLLGFALMEVRDQLRK
jgi:ribA/ribD-fused uncharacterized protein